MLSYITKAEIFTTKFELNAEQEEIIKLQAFNSSYFLDKNHLEDGRSQI